MTEREQSPFERRAYAYIERGYSVIPIAPGTKRPGEYIPGIGWRGMSNWTQFSLRLPTEAELSTWYEWKKAGIGLLTGKLSMVIGLDRDYNTKGTDALDALIPYTPVKKRGAKGYTAFFRYNGEKSVSFNINGIRVLDVLSDGRQTLMPGTIHPDGQTYIYLTDDTLEDYDPADLPVLPDNFMEKVAAVLAPYQTEDDTRNQKTVFRDKEETGEPLDTSLSMQAQFYQNLNQTALEQIDLWVPKIIPNTYKERDGYRTVAIWRDCKNPNVGIHRTGIFDFGGNYGMTALDLVMNACRVEFGMAVEILMSMLKMSDLTGGVDISGIMSQWDMPEPPHINVPPSEDSTESVKAVPAFILNPPGILADIVNWMVATAPKPQPELALAAAIALGSVVMGRSYKTNKKNFSSLYLVMVGKSGEGKEHPQNCVSDLLTAAGLGQLIGGSGYTSAGAIYSALLKAPCHLATIDELGKLLKSSRGSGAVHSEAAIDKLLEAFGRLGSVLRPPAYSTMALKQKEKPADIVIHNPAITLLGATTPATFFDNLTDDLVKDGFLGRCIVVESNQPRQVAQLSDDVPPPDRIIEWMKRVHISGAGVGDLADIQDPSTPAITIPMTFAADAVEYIKKFQGQLIRDMDSAEGEDGLDVLYVRTAEKALRLSMVVCKAEDQEASEIKLHHVKWALDYVYHYDRNLISAVTKNRFSGLDDKMMKKIVSIIENSAKMIPTNPKYAHMLSAGRVPHFLLLRRMKIKSKDFEALVATVVQAGAIYKGIGANDYGYAGEVYWLA